MKAYFDYSDEEMEALIKHQRFLLDCEPRTLISLLIRQLEKHSPADMEPFLIPPIILGGDVVLTTDLAGAMAKALRELRGKAEKS